MFTGPNIVTDGLVLYLDAANTKSYPGTGTTWSDLSGNGNNGTLVNGPTFDPENNGSIVFDGINDYTTIPDNPSLNPTSQITVNCFFKLNILTTSGYPTLVVKDNSTSNFGGTQYGLTIFRGGIANRGVFFRANIDSISTTVGSINNNGGIVDINAYDLVSKWSMLTGTYNGISMKIYLNAVLVGELPVSGQLGTVAEPLSIGRNGVKSDYIAGANIAQTSIYNRALSPEEVLQNYNATKTRFKI